MCLLRVPMPCFPSNSAVSIFQRYILHRPLFSFWICHNFAGNYDNFLVEERPIFLIRNVCSRRSVVAGNLDAEILLGDWSRGEEWSNRHKRSTSTGLVGWFALEMRIFFCAVVSVWWFLTYQGLFERLLGLKKKLHKVGSQRMSDFSGFIEAWRYDFSSPWFLRLYCFSTVLHDWLQLSLLVPLNCFCVFHSYLHFHWGVLVKFVIWASGFLLSVPFLWEKKSNNLHARISMSPCQLWSRSAVKIPAGKITCQTEFSFRSGQWDITDRLKEIGQKRSKTKS